MSEEACKAGSVQKDLNLVESGRILRLGPGLVDVFLDVLSADALFLRTLRIMDYSLLVRFYDLILILLLLLEAYLSIDICVT